MLVHEGGIHFISASTFSRAKYFSDDDLCQILDEQLRFYSESYKVELVAYVIMPDHFHCLIWPKGEKTYSDYMRGVKSFSARLILEVLDRQGQGTPPMKTNGWIKNRRGAYTPPPRKVWQDSFFTYVINSIEKLEQKLEYIKQNPVQAGLVSKSEDYRWLYVNPKLSEIEF